MNPETMFDSDNLQATAAALFRAAQNHGWSFLLAAALMGGVAAARKYGASKMPFLGTAKGGIVLALAGSVAAALVTATVGGAPLTGAVLLSALAVTAKSGLLWQAAKAFAPSLLGAMGLTGAPSAATVAAAESAGAQAAATAPVESVDQLVNGK